MFLLRHGSRRSSIAFFVLTFDLIFLSYGHLGPGTRAIERLLWKARIIRVGRIRSGLFRLGLLGWSLIRVRKVLCELWKTQVRNGNGRKVRRRRWRYASIGELLELVRSEG